MDISTELCNIVDLKKKGGGVSGGKLKKGDIYLERAEEFQFETDRLLQAIGERIEGLG